MVLMDVAELVSLHDRTIHWIITVPERVNPCLVPMAPTPALSSPNVSKSESWRCGWGSTWNISACRRKRVQLYLVGGLVNVMIRLSSMTVVLIVKTEKTSS